MFECSFIVQICLVSIWIIIIKLIARHLRKIPLPIQQNPDKVYYKERIVCWVFSWQTRESFIRPCHTHSLGSYNSFSVAIQTVLVVECQWTKNYSLFKRISNISYHLSVPFVLYVSRTFLLNYFKDKHYFIQLKYRVSTKELCGFEGQY